ncbi:MAG: hypothetical protein ACLGI6_08590 [Gammaproteobacteria bacterium]
MAQLRLNLYMIAATVLLFSAMLGLNELLLRPLEFARGINWIYLPAGMRLLCTLLFAEAGAVGLLIVSWLSCFLLFFPDDWVRAFMAGILSTTAPYLVYLGARRLYGLQASLANLTGRRLLACVLAYSLASPALLNSWYWMRGDKGPLLLDFLVMAAGDLMGTLIVIYTAKGLLALALARRARSRPRSGSQSRSQSV